MTGLVFASVCVSWISMAVLGLQEPNAAMRTIARGSQSNIDAPRQSVVRTQGEWEALWRAHDYDKPAPTVDFSKEMVVAVFMGSRPTGGYGVEITSVAERNGALVVSYRERSPSPGAIAAQVLTFPFHIVAVPRRAGDVKFEKVPQ
jgi:hypothetical protein